VTTGAGTTSELDGGSGVDGQAVILVGYGSTSDGDTSGGANVESIGVVACQSFG
jgi:hypothetical protein